MNKKIRQHLGFSLIELLVVISIMALLLALAAVSFSSAQRKGRDAKRRGDMQAIQKGFEQYFSDNNAYATCATMGGSTTYFPAGLPSDPSPSQSYSSSCSATAYCYCARLETTNTGNSTAAAASTTCSFAAGGTRNYFCVSSLQ